MSINKEKWMEEAAYKLDLLYEFDEIFLVPDAKTLNAFLKHPTLIIKTGQKDYPAALKELLEKYDKFEKNKTSGVPLSEDDLSKLSKSYEKGMTPTQAAIDIVKLCDTPEESGQFFVSPQIYTFNVLVIIGLLIGLTVAALTLYVMTKEKLKVKDESAHVSTIYQKAAEFNAKNSVDLDNEKAIKSGLIPKEMKIDNNKISNVWDGAVTIESNPKFFKLTYDQVPTSDSCVDLLSRQKDIGWDTIVVGEQTFENYKNITNIDVTKACDLREKHVNIVFKKIKI